PGDRATGARSRARTVAARATPRPGGRGYLPRPRAGMAASRAGTLQSRSVEGHVGDRAVPQRRLGRTLPALLIVRASSGRLQLVPQPALPQVPEQRRAAL